MSNLCLETISFDKIKTIFTETQRQLKAPKRPELRDPDFVKGRLRRVIVTPSFVYQDLERPKERFTCYLKEYESNGKTRYTKVILEKRSRHHFVITAFRPNYVKEKGKTKLIYGDEPK